ncbi:MAG TPA: hypothetical protein VIJ59_08625 [Caulobacteraceae bacterium]
MAMGKTPPESAVGSLRPNPPLAKAAAVAVGLAAIAHIAVGASLIGRWTHPWGQGDSAPFAASSHNDRAAP